MYMKCIFITGASSGIGRAATILFAKKGWHVLAGVRNLEKGQELLKEEGRITLIKIDVTDDKQITEATDLILEKGGIDVLFNNAGYGMKGTLESVPEENMRKLFETDMIGTIKVIQKFIPYFKQKKSGLILTTTSLAGIISFPMDYVYNCAKRGMEGLCEALYYEMKPYGVKVKTIVPGAIKTNFKMEMFTKDEYAQVNERLAKVLIPDFDKFPLPEEAAEVVYEAVEDPSEQFHYVVGDAAKELLKLREEMGLEKFKEYFYKRLYNN